jgi:hypothetical protein
VVCSEGQGPVVDSDGDRLADVYVPLPNTGPGCSPDPPRTLEIADEPRWGADALFGTLYRD